MAFYNLLQIKLFHLGACPWRATQKLQARFEAGVMGKAADRHGFPHRLPAHALGKPRNHHFQRNTLQGRAACIIRIHVCILQGFASHERYNTVSCFHLHFGMFTPIRLDKYLAATLPCSRREAELYITGGWVSVDGLAVEEPQFMVSVQKVELHPDASLTPIEPVTILLHQPADTGPNPSAALQLIRPETRAAHDRSGIHLLKQHFLRLAPQIPLERNASGLVIYTQDWRAARKLSDDAASLEQEYIVEVAGELPAEKLKLLNYGLSYNGHPLPPGKVSWQNETHLRFAIKGLHPGQIAHMCQSVGLPVLAMKRLRIGRVSMGKLPPGQWRFLMPKEQF